MPSGAQFGLHRRVRAYRILLHTDVHHLPFPRGVTVTFRDMAIRDCLLNDAFAVILARNGASVTLQNLEVTNVRNVAAPGVVYGLDSAITITDSFFQNNRGYDGAIVFAQNCDISVARNDFVNNLAYDDGVAIWAENSMTTVEECSFRDNVADFSGGALFAKVRYPLLPPFPLMEQWSDHRAAH